MQFATRLGFLFVLMLVGSDVCHLLAQEKSVGAVPESERRRRLKAMEDTLEHEMSLKPYHDLADLTLKDHVDMVNEFLRMSGEEFRVMVDSHAFGETLPPDSANILQARITFPKQPDKMKLKDVLIWGIRQLPTSDRDTQRAVYVVNQSGIVIVPGSRAVPRYQKVHGTYRNASVDEIFEDFSWQTGTPILVDPAGDKSKALTVRLPAETSLLPAVQTVADMASLKMYVVDNLIYVTPKKSFEPALPRDPSREGGEVGSAFKESSWAIPQPQGAVPGVKGGRVGTHPLMPWTTLFPIPKSPHQQCEAVASPLARNPLTQGTSSECPYQNPKYPIFRD